MNIVIISRGKFPGFDGPYRRTRLLGAGFAKNGCEVSLIVAYPPEWKKCDTEFFEKNNFRYYHTLSVDLDRNPTLLRKIFYKITGTFKVLPLFQKIAGDRKVDVVFLYGLGFLELFTAFLLKKKYKAIIAVDKTDINYQFHKHYKNGKFSFLSLIRNLSVYELLSGLNIALGEYFIRNHVEIIFTVSSYLREMYKGKVKGIIRMSNPALIETGAYNGSQDLLNIKTEPSSLKVLCVCVNESYFYGFFPFIEALGNLKGRHRFRLYVLGSERRVYLETLSDKLMQHGIEELTTVFYKISDEEVISLYTNVDILLMAQANPKLADGGLSSKLSEYLISGNPMITTLFSDLSQYLENDKNCLVVPYGNIGACESALNRLFESQVLRTYLANEAKKTCLEHFDYISGTKDVILSLKQVLE